MAGQQYVVNDTFVVDKRFVVNGTFGVDNRCFFLIQAKLQFLYIQPTKCRPFSPERVECQNKKKKKNLRLVDASFYVSASLIHRGFCGFSLPFWSLLAPERGFLDKMLQPYFLD